jgi:1-deoxy-D-xylulose-5-phosphate synthase
MVIAAPRDENEMQHLLYTAVRVKKPMAIRYPRGSISGVTMDSEFKTIEIGRSEILRYGNDIAILAVGAMVRPALDSAHDLSRSGIDCAVIDARFVKPLDKQLLTNIADVTRRIVTIEENTLAGGFGSIVASFLHSSGRRDVRLKCIGLPDTFIEHGSQAALRKKYQLDTAGIKAQIWNAFPELLLRDSVLEKQATRPV